MLEKSEERRGDKRREKEDRRGEELDARWSDMAYSCR